MNTRTLFIAVVLSLAFGSLLAAGGESGKTTKEQIVTEVTRLGGKVALDETAAGAPIVRIDLHGTSITDADLRFLKDGKQHLKKLNFLDLRLTRIGDSGVANLRHLTALQTLNLFRTQLSDRGLRDLGKLEELQTLLIGGTKVTDAGLGELRSLTKLRKLSLFQTQVSDAGIPFLKILAHLETLLIGGTRITPQGAQELQRTLPSLRFSENT